jgi:hypothetical protein
MMHDQWSDAEFDAQVANLAKDFVYPAVPNIAAQFRQPRLSLYRRQVKRPVWSMVAVLAFVLLCVSLLASPVRARVVEWLRIGAVRIFPIDPDIPFVPSLPSDAASGLNSLAGETTLTAALEKAGFDLKIPLELGEPDRVYYQELDRARLVIMLWRDREQGDLALYQIAGPVSIINKRYVGDIEETTVGSEWAVWVEGPYQLYIETGTEIDIRAVEGSTLLWQQDGITYRLESHLTLDEARRIAQSLQLIAP